MNTQSQPVIDATPAKPPLELFLFTGGPLFQSLRSTWLLGQADAGSRRLIVLTMLAWLPLLALSAFEGRLTSSGAAVPFLFDLEVQIRFLLALPLLMLAEIAAQRRIQSLPQQFIERDLIPEPMISKFSAVVDSAHRLRSSGLADFLLLAFVYGVGVLVIWRHFVAIDVDTWYSSTSADGPRLSMAGMWYGFVSLPIFQFLLCRWYFRIYVWGRFLAQSSQIPLNLAPSHPDKLAGLSFLPRAANAFAVLAVAHGALLAGYLSTRVVLLGEPLFNFKTEIALVVIFVLCLTLGPLVVFAKRLIIAKRRGLREYGVLAERYARGFDAKWLRVGEPKVDGLMGSADIQSLADMSNSYNLVQDMRSVPITRDMVLKLTVATLVPIVPFVLTLMSVEELGKKLISILLK